MKSIFTKLSTLLLCGAVAMVGCTDFSEDIQAVDTKVDGLTTELNNYKASTAATIAELEASIAALEAKQEQMAADYAKKSELEAAKTELQDKLSAEIAKVNASISDAVDAIAALEAGKADKTEVADLKKTVEDAIAEANAAIAALDAAKADKTQVDQIAGDVATLIEGYQQMIAQFQNLSLIVDGKAEQADLELVQADVNSLKQGYMETVSALQNLAGRMEAAEGAIELAEGDIADLKKAAAEAVFAITNLNAQVEALDARVEALEGEMKKVQSEIALHTEALQNLAGRLEAAEGAIEDEAAARAKADEALQEAVSLLNMGLTNLQVAYNVHIEEFEAYKDNMAKAIEALELQDALIYKTIQDNFNTLITSIDETAAALRAEQAEAIAALEKKIVEAWETERALIYNTIADIQKTLFAAIEEGDAALQEAMEAADALIYKTIDSYISIFEIAILEGDAAEAEAREAADALLYNTILDIQNTLMAAVEEGDAAVLETVAADLEDKLALVYNTIEDIKTTLFIAIEEGDAAVAKAAQDALDDAVALIYKTIDSTKQELQAEIAESNKNLTEYVDDAVALIYKTIASNKADIQAEIQDLRNELEIILGGLTADVTALLERVQSLVYVPDYSDHKATIEWAKVAGSYATMPAAAEDGNNANYSIITKATDIKYLVKANAGEDAETIAATIAANPSVLDYIVTDVKTRGASESGADLEIVNVKADGEYIIVSVVAKKFDAKFFENKRQGIYSAALQLVDTKGNNLTSEYTNLVPGEAANIQLGLYLAEGDDVNNVTNTQYTDYMPCNDNETVYTSVCPAIGFITDDEKAMANLTSIQPYLTVEDLKALGYDMSVNYRLDLDKAISTSIPSGMVSSGNIFNKYFKVGNDRNANVQVSVVENTPFEAVGQSIYAKYTATVNGTTVSYTHYFELDNAQIVVNVGDYNETTGEYSVEVPWTVKLRDELTVEGKQYAADLNVASTWTGYDDIKSLMNVNNNLLSGRKYTYFVKDNNGKWAETSDIKFDLGGWPSEANPNLKWGLKGGTYAWNNEYKVVYTAVNETEHIDITVNFILKLTHKPVAPFAVNIPVTFEIAPSGAFQAPVDVLAEMYKKVAGVEEGSYDYLGFGEKNADVWAAYTSGVPATYMDGYMGAPVVNENKGAAGYVSNIWNLTLAQVAQNQYVDGKNVITWDANGIIDFDFDVTISGEANIPAYDLIYATDYATDANPRVHVNGKKDDQSGKYVIDQADLAKYFNVTRLDLAGGKKGIAEGHSLTVDFTVTDPEIAAKLNAPAFATVVEDNKGTYLTLKSDVAVLQWNEFTGLEIPVTASLKVNGFELETLDLVLWTEDPLTLKNVAPVSEKRAPGKTPTVAKIYQNLSLTGILEPEKNLIDASVKVESAWSETYTQATDLYGANMTISFAMAEEGVYYEENGKKIYLDKNKFELDPVMGTITLYGDDADLNVTYIAKCYVQLTHRFCEDAHAKAQLVTVKFVPNK